MMMKFGFRAPSAGDAAGRAAKAALTARNNRMVVRRKGRGRMAGRVLSRDNPASSHPLEDLSGFKGQPAQMAQNLIKFKSQHAMDGQILSGFGSHHAPSRQILIGFESHLTPGRQILIGYKGHPAWLSQELSVVDTHQGAVSYILTGFEGRHARLSQQ